MNTWLKQNTMLSIGLFVLVTLVIAYYFGSRTGKGKAASTTGKEYEKETNKSLLSYDPAQYASFADRLESAMFGFTDNEDAIYSVFTKMRTKSDLFQLITAFGERRIMATIGKVNLPTWINNRLDSTEIAQLNEILQRNNIDFNF